MRKMNLANKLTMLRLILVPVFIIVYLFPYEKVGITFQVYHFLGTDLTIMHLITTLIFVVAAITDFLDGQIARKNNWVTTFGKFADPIADKLLVNSALIVLTYFDKMSLIVLIVMILRDTIVDGIRFACASRNVVIAASIYGKAKTMVQMIAIVLLLLNNPIFATFNIPFDRILIDIAGVISAVSGIEYFVKNRQYILETM